MGSAAIFVKLVGACTCMGVDCVVVARVTWAPLTLTAVGNEVVLAACRLVILVVVIVAVAECCGMITKAVGPVGFAVLVRAIGWLSCWVPLAITLSDVVAVVAVVVAVDVVVIAEVEMVVA